MSVPHIPSRMTERSQRSRRTRRCEAALAERKIERALMHARADVRRVLRLRRATIRRRRRRAGASTSAPTKESIHVGPLVAALDIPCIEMVLRHELLHRSMYHGFGEQHAHHEIANLTLDICINRLLFEAYPDRMRKTSLAIYSEESKLAPDRAGRLQRRSDEAAARARGAVAVDLVEERGGREISVAESALDLLPPASAPADRRDPEVRDVLQHRPLAAEEAGRSHADGW